MEHNYYIRITNLSDVNEILLDQEQGTTLIREGFVPIYHDVFKVGEFSYLVAVFTRTHKNVEEDVTSGFSGHYLSVNGIERHDTNIVQADGRPSGSGT